MRAISISPTVSPEVLAEGARLGVPVVPGAMTPTEILAAYTAGAAMVKVFPCGEIGGPGFVRAVRGPLPNIPLLPTGGVAIDSAREYLAAGAAAVGIGSPLQGDAATAGGDLRRCGPGRRGWSPAWPTPVVEAGPVATEASTSSRWARRWAWWRSTTPARWPSVPLGG